MGRNEFTAWLVLCLANLLGGMALTDDPHSVMRLGFLSRDFLETAVAVALLYAYLVLILRLVRKPGRSADGDLRARARRMRAWGYVWRSYVVLLVVLLPLVTRSIGDLQAGRAASPMPAWLLVSLLLFGPPPVAWLIFGQDLKSFIIRLPGSRNRRKR